LRRLVDGGVVTVSGKRGKRLHGVVVELSNQCTQSASRPTRRRAMSRPSCPPTCPRAWPAVLARAQALPGRAASLQAEIDGRRAENAVCGHLRAGR
jgi:hypothetical protein